eukprot:767125-Hanusia_phi.AAC.12
MAGGAGGAGGRDAHLDVPGFGDWLKKSLDENMGRGEGRAKEEKRNESLRGKKRTIPGRNQFAKKIEDRFSDVIASLRDVLVVFSTCSQTDVNKIMENAVESRFQVTPSPLHPSPAPAAFSPAAPAPPPPAPAAP